MPSVFRLLIAASLVMCVVAQSEEERVQTWHEQGNVWPPNWQPETEGMQRLMAFREQEIMSIPGSHERWENWMQYVQSRLVPKFTPVGFKLIQTPASVQEKLNAVVQKALLNWDAIPEEGKIDVIYNPTENLLPKFVHLGAIQNEIHRELLPLHEEWSGMKLKPTSAYGIRLYRNGSSLSMHNDKAGTHVISSIVHVAHEYDNEDYPWPVQIEDHDGNLHTINMQAGQMLFYESAKCLHGRMQTFRGKYYGSIFVHYQPVDKSLWNYQNEDAIDRIPPHWHDGAFEPKGSRWAGAALTVDSRVPEGAPNRIINGEVTQVTQPHGYGPMVPPPEWPQATAAGTVSPTEL